MNISFNVTEEEYELILEALRRRWVGSFFNDHTLTQKLVQLRNNLDSQHNEFKIANILGAMKRSPA